MAMQNKRKQITRGALGRECSVAFYLRDVSLRYGYLRDAFLRYGCLRDAFFPYACLGDAFLPYC